VGQIHLAGPGQFLTADDTSVFSVCQNEFRARLKLADLLRRAARISTRLGVVVLDTRLK
jgi:hypothetical protein